MKGGYECESLEIILLFLNLGLSTTPPPPLTFASLDVE